MMTRPTQTQNTHQPFASGSAVLQEAGQLLDAVVSKLEALQEQAKALVQASIAEETNLTAENPAAQAFLSTRSAVLNLLVAGREKGLCPRDLRKSNLLKYTTSPKQGEPTDFGHILVPFSVRYIHELGQRLQQVSIRSKRSVQHFHDVLLPVEMGYLSHLLEDCKKEAARI